MIEMDIIFYIPLVFKVQTSLYLILHSKAQSSFHEHFTYMQKFEVIGPIPERETKHKTIRCIECFGGDVALVWTSV